MTSKENLSDFKEDLLDEIDYLKLEPINIKKKLIISSSMYLVALVFIIVYAIYRTPWLSVFLVVSAGLIIMGSFLLYFEYIRLSDDKNIYIFDRDGFKIEKVDDTSFFIPWEDITDVKLKGRYGSQKRKRRCIMTTQFGKIILVVNGFNEVTSKIKHPDTILREILKYYERIKNA